MSDPFAIDTIDGLEALYGSPRKESVRKETDHLTTEYRAWLESSPFFALATIGPDGIDCSPRGDVDRAVTVVDAYTLHIPDRRGNNRLDSLRNIVNDGRVGLLFLTPGVPECLRLNGTASLTADPELCDRYRLDGRSPATVIAVQIATVFLQSTRAVKRSGLWGIAHP